MGNKIILSLSMILIGFIFFINFTGSIGWERIQIFGFGFIFYGFISVIVNLGKGNRGLLFLASFIFIVGCVILVVYANELYSPERFTFPALLVALGTGFLTLYLDNKIVKAFIYTSVLLLTLGFLTAHKFELLGVAPIANKYCNAVLDIWPALIIISVILVLFRKEKLSDNS